MAEIGPVPWPPDPIHTARLTLREPEARDRTGVIELNASPQVRTYLGGPRRREDLEKEIPETPSRRPGLFTVEHDGSMIGVVTIDRRDPERPGHLHSEGLELELGYMLLPTSWGCGYAVEACTAALDWCTSAAPGEPVVLCTQTANSRSLRVAAALGFTEVERFEEFGAQQWFGVRTPPPTTW